ncbi:hypothetical protein MTR_4g055510 [Medicago truncatula]|uniref:Uncharacterized protein n=1 Tax=Medicago truncatula TaxID=3880 RepID=G7JM36_MEDTR|nr:hypothetical protein MTR_4g055510 [Medicago truncatula]
MGWSKKTKRAKNHVSSHNGVFFNLVLWGTTISRARVEDVRLRDQEGMDELLNNDGEFSVKSTYDMLEDLLLEGSKGDVEDRVFKVLWKSPAHQK